MTNFDRYNNSLEHLLDELKIINVLLSRHFFELRQDGPESENLFHGLAISDNRIMNILKKLNKPIQDDKLKQTFQQDEINIIEQQIRQKKIKSKNNNISLALPTLSERFSLTQFEEKILLVCLAPEIDTSYEIIYSYLQDNISKKRPSANFILDLLCQSTQEKMFCKRYLSSQAKLRHYGLIKSDIEQNQTVNELFVLDPRVLGFLLDSESIDHAIRNQCEYILPDKQPILSLSHEKILEKTLHTITDLQKDQSRMRLCFSGPEGVGKKALLQAACYALKKPLLCLDCENILNSTENISELSTKILREAILCDLAIYVSNFESCLDDLQKKARFLSLLSFLDGIKFLFFGTRLDPIPEFLKQEDTICVYLLEPSYLERKKIWRSYLQNKMADNKIDELANRFVLTAQQIESAYFAAQNQRRLEKQNNDEITLDDLYLACRQQYHGKLTSLAHKIVTNYTLDDLALPLTKKAQIQEIINHVKNKNQVYYDWGFGEKITINKGINILFHGQSGTGKTMAAGILARELGFDLYKINLPDILSKYVGDMEKKLDDLFRKLKSSNAILFVDEADALFGKRTELRDSHDRYANMEVSYLLQKLEEHDEIIILATNLMKNMDEAFLRRMHFLIDFPFPNKSQRLKIWRDSFPDTCPTDISESEHDFLAESFDVSGGNIKNIIVSAAFLAAQSSSSINMDHIILAIKKEYEKIGRPCNRTEFGQYFSLIQNPMIS